VLKDQRAKKKEEDVEIGHGLRETYSFVEVSISDIAKVQETHACEEAEPETTEVRVLQLLEDALLTRRERLVLVWSFGLRDGQERNLEEIANVLMLVESNALSREDVRKIRDAGVGKVKAYLDDHGLEGSWEL
jgi:DNA-directed RNA polymerase sigma subunit (sigma70/sigma32)